MTVSRGSSILGVKRHPLFMLWAFAIWEFSVSCIFWKVACFNKNDNLAVKSDTASKLKSLAALSVMYDRFE